ncbi:hypothetical protein EDD16DRAFT_1527984 [Pisolithus croceorrhizus]|nr:hypothetical protein EDD16DRAFT_1527984 [Pisolithus croceorrhizus]KAI6096993.1 hypothetical protein EV401DRAFT_1895613 [Pisolithus croceorrhizus]
MNTVHTLGLFHEYETPRQYGVRDFLHISRKIQQSLYAISITSLGLPACISSFWSTWRASYSLSKSTMSTGGTLVMTRQGTTSFSRGWLAILGSYKLSQVQLLVDLHAISFQEIVPAIATKRHAFHLVTPDILRGLVMLIRLLNHGVTLEFDMATTCQEVYLNPASTWTLTKWMTIVRALLR